jgi:hypothetical protein
MSVKGILRQNNDKNDLVYSNHVKMTFLKVQTWISVLILYILGLKCKYIYVCITKSRRQQNHRTLLKQTMWLEKTLEVTITDIVDIVWLKQV